MHIIKRTIKNVLSIWATKLFSILSGLILVPVLLSTLGKHDYGLWLTLGQGISMLALLDFGIANSVARFVSKADALEDINEKTGIYSTAIFVFSVAAMLILLVVLISVNYIPTLLNVDAASHQVTKVLFLALGCKLAISFPFRAGRGLLQSKYRYDYIEIIGLIAKLFNFCLIFILFKFQLIDLYMLCAVTVVNNIAVEWLLFCKGKTLYPSIKFKAGMINKDRFKRLFSLGTSALVQTLAGMFNSKGYVLAISVIFGMELVPIFAVANNLLRRLGGLIGRIGATFIPIASRADAKSEDEKITNLTIYGTRYSLMLGFIFSGYLLIYGKDLIVLWLGHGQISSEDINLIFLSMMIMLFPVFISRANMGNRSILIATGSHWLVSNSICIFSICALIVGILLMKYTSLGILGAAVGWSLSPLILEGVFFPIFVAIKNKIAVSEYFLRVLINPIVVFLIVCILNVSIANLFVHDTIINLAFGTILYGVIACGLIFFLGLESSHRKKITSHILKKARA